MNCLETQSKIIAFIENRLSDDEMLAFEKHIHSCQNCSEELEIYYTLMVGMKRLDNDQELPADFKVEMENKLASSCKSIKNKKKFTGSSIALIAIMASFVFLLGLQSYRKTVYLQEQQLIKDAQSPYYYSDYYSDSLFHTVDYKQMDVYGMLRPKDENPTSYYMRLNNYIQEQFGVEEEENSDAETITD